MARLSPAPVELPPERRKALPSVLARALALGLGYAALSKLIDIVTTFGNTTGATFWPGAGLTVAVLLKRPKWEWPFYVAAVAIAEATVDMWIGFGVPLSLAWAVANTAEPLVAALLLRRRRRGPPDLSRRVDLGPFVLAAIVIGPLVGATLGTAAGAVLAGDPWLPRLPRWYIGDAVGVLIVAPAVLILWPPLPRAERGPVTPWLAALTLAVVLALGPWTFSGAAGLPFLTLPLLIWIAMRFGLRGGVAAVLLVASIVLAVTADGRGPFADDEGAFAGLVVAQMFVAMSAVTVYTVSVMAGELISRDQLADELRARALRDSLTGLANRRLLFDRLERASARLARSPGMAALLFIDLDDFKRINDTHGHVVGDAVLVESADRLREVVRDQDSVARIGGDEFLVLAEGLHGADDAYALAGRIVAAFDEPFESIVGPLRVTTSVGIATTRDPIDDPGAFLADADHAMYAAKRAGGHQIAGLAATGDRAIAARERSGRS